ncbi:MAG: 16S rRNA (guanine(966)-N(2))-methyltransferase RsmD [Burkholderiaceae bacterium]
MKKKLTGAPRQVRIIGGLWTRTPLPVLDAEGLRPTPDRVRETVFNWLGFLQKSGWSQIRCLDLFAGSGALGFEAASRGAASVLMVESQTVVLRQLEAIRDKLHADQIRLLRADAMVLAAGMKERFDLIFLDPPYQLQLLPQLLPLCLPLLAPGGFVYVETEQHLEASPPPWLAGWHIVRADHAGAVQYALLQADDNASN